MIHLLIIIQALQLVTAVDVELPSTSIKTNEWEDNFDDGNLEGWAVSGISWTLDHGWDIWDGVCSVKDSQVQFGEVSYWEEWVTDE